MFIAMNRFRVKAASAGQFENVWRYRESHLGAMPGFMNFQLLKSEIDAETVEFVSHSTWLDEAAFANWRDSESSRKAHAGSSSVRDMVLGPPEFRGYAVLMNQTTGERTDFRSAHMDQLIEKTFAIEDPAQVELRESSVTDGLPPIRIAALEGRILECLLRAANARRGLEIGTLGGYSASWLLRALPQDGHLTSIELDPTRAIRAQEKFEALGWGERVNFVPGDATYLFDQELKDLKDLDFVFIDADKVSYPYYIDVCVSRLRRGGLMLLDNAFIWGGMNFFGVAPEKLPPSLQKGYHEYSRPNSRPCLQPGKNSPHTPS